MQKERCPHLSSFAIHLKQMQDGEKSCPNNCLTEIPHCKSNHGLRTLAHSDTHAKKWGKLKLEKSRPSRWWLFHTLYYYLWDLPGSLGWKVHFLVAEHSRQAFSRVACLDALWATRKKRMSKKHETGVNKAVKTWWKMQAPTTFFSADFLSGESCHEKHTSFSFLSTKNFPDTLPWFTTKMQLVSSFITTQSAPFISIITNEPRNSADKKTNPEATNVILVIQSC